MERKPRGFWYEWDNAWKALDPIVKELGYLPGQSEMRRHRLSSLTLPIRKYFGGHQEVARRLGVPTAEEFRRSKLEDWEIFQKEMWPIVNRYGRMPSKAELLGIGRSDIANAIRKYHGGQDEAAARLGVPTYNKQQGLHDRDYWTVERIVDEYISFIEEYGFIHWPSPNDLREKGYGDLEGAVRKIGHRKFRKMIEERGIYLEKKPRKLDHLIPFERKYEILPEVFEETELKYYIVGIVSADGSIVSRKKEQAIELCLNKVDVGILEKLRDRISPGRPIHVKPHKENSDSDAVRLNSAGRKLYHFLENICRFIKSLSRSLTRATFRMISFDIIFVHILMATEPSAFQRVNELCMEGKNITSPHDSAYSGQKTSSPV